MEIKPQPILLLCCTHSFGAKFLRGQVKYMAERGFQVFVISSKGKEIESLCEDEGGTLIPFPFERDIRPWKDLFAIFKLRKILKLINPTIINTGTPKAGLLITIAAKLAGISPIIFTLRGLRSETLIGLKYSIVKNMETITCKLADVVVPISPSLKEHAQKKGILSKGKGVVLGRGSSNGVNVDEFTPSLSLSEKNDLRKDLGINDNDFVISYVGRINNDKGVSELFDAFKKIAIYPNVKLLIVGKFEKEDALPLDIQDELRMHPQVVIRGYREDIKSIYEIVDLLVLYSKREGFGNILVEASSMEVPVIASNIPGCMDAVKDGVSGYLVNNSDELFDRLKFYLENQDEAKRDGKTGSIWVRENFDSRIIWHKQYELYQSLLSRKYGT